MAKIPKKKSDLGKNIQMIQVDPTECPFREFRDQELSVDYWGMGPAAFRAAVLVKAATKLPSDYVWVDEQAQPLPRSVRHYLHGWIRAEELAVSRWEADVVMFEENKMSVTDIQLGHAQVLYRSSFCRRLLSACYKLERSDVVLIDHTTGEHFAFNFGPEGWRARYHIYSPGMKPGGGAQHRPGLSKSGCYLVRLYYLGAWRCVWVSDRVPVDATDAPLLPFSPLMSHAPTKSAKQIPALVTSGVVHLWPLLLCKAILKLAAPDMNSDEQADDMEEDPDVEDELIKEFDILHTLTGCMSTVYHIQHPEKIWKLLISEVTVFNWDEDDETVTSTVKSKSTKKPSAKEPTVLRRSIVSVFLDETKNEPHYALPGITPAHAMSVIVTMARDVPLKKPLPEPDVPLWKTYRWVDWARRHGLYEAYECPRTRYLKVNGLMKLSYAPYLLDVQSTESITHCFREEQEKQTAKEAKKAAKDANRSATGMPTSVQLKEELREWIQYEALQKTSALAVPTMRSAMDVACKRPLQLILFIISLAMWIRSVKIVYFPSVFQFTSAASSPPIRPITKTLPNRSVDIQAPKAAPLYLQIDGPEENKLRISLSMLHPRILVNSGVPLVDYIEKAYLILETFEWFKDVEIPKAKAFITTRGYESVEINFLPGRHFCRVWVHSRTNWYIAMISESTLLLGTRDLIQSAAVRECPWAAKFLASLGMAFSNWIRINRSNTDVVVTCDREFYSSYQPDLEWDPKVVGRNKSLLHWMFRQALQSLLSKRLQHTEFQNVCVTLRRNLRDPDFGMPHKPLPPKSLREIVSTDPCDCVMPEVEEVEGMEEVMEEQGSPGEDEEKPVVSPEVMKQLLEPPVPPTTSQVCELATEEVPCGLMKDEREKFIRKHEAATVIQAHWRGVWARKCLRKHVVVSSEVIKLLMENAFGNLEVLSALMNEFFLMFPEAKYAYSVSSALSGVNGLHQHFGTSSMSSKCKWVPYFQGVFYCHYPVKVHFDIQSSLPHSTVAVYNNDTGLQLPQAFNAHITFDIEPNNYGYTVMGHGSVTHPEPQHLHPGHTTDVHWQLTVLTSIDNVFHICDNPENDLCTILPLNPASKLHIEEIFIPNRRNILGGMTISVSKIEAVSFRAAATSHNLEMEAVLRTTNHIGEVEEIARCAGTGEICWPYMRLKSTILNHLTKKKSASHINIPLTAKESLYNTNAKGKRKAASAGIKQSKSTTKLKESSKPAPVESKIYTIEVIAPNGWPLSLDQWRRVDIIRNSLEQIKVEAAPPKKATKEKGGSAKDKKEPEKEKPVTFTVHQPLPDDAYVELECSTAVGGGAFAKRDDERDILFALTRRSWDAKEPGRNVRGAKIRKDFHEEFLVPLPSPATKPASAPISVEEETIFETEGEESKDNQQTQQGPTPATESGLLEAMPEEEEEAKYFTMPEQLRDKFVPLYFVPLCTKEKNDDDSVLVTPDIAEAAKAERHSRIERALQRMRELQIFNEIFVLGRQKKRCVLLDRLCIDASWRPELLQVLEERDEAIARELLEISGTKKKAGQVPDASAGKKQSAVGKKK